MQSQNYCTIHFVYSSGEVVKNTYKIQQVLFEIQFFFQKIRLIYIIKQNKQSDQNKISIKLMGTAVLVIVLIILLAVLLTICYFWNKMLCDCLRIRSLKAFVRRSLSEKDQKIPDQISIQINPDQSAINKSNKSMIMYQIPLEFSEDHDDNKNQLGTKFVKFDLDENFAFKTMKICSNLIIYARKEEKQKIQKFYTTRYDEQYNEYFQCHEENQNNPRFRIYEGKTNKIKYEGDNRQPELVCSNNDLEKRYNQKLLKSFSKTISIEVINAFALFLNLQEQEVYFKQNQQQQIYKRKWFIPSDQQLESYFWQFELIGYDVEMFSEAIYLIQQDEEQNIFFVEVNFTDTLTIHTTNVQQLDHYEPILEQLNKFFKNSINHSFICFQCKERETSNPNICLNMLFYSNSPLKKTLQTNEQMQGFIQKEIFQE
ncbi:hypothetical protein FGO68_gene11898 [Halteria grandinella]|uniref:Uncharacterized protein n=1 Tax=Halteria grandinella TaxID=5974 RepID=A0A8J8NG09_HALGN|nr:hypothetical protein FGO68_gene11898 [Halteria grandinella]